MNDLLTNAAKWKPGDQTNSPEFDFTNVDLQSLTTRDKYRLLVELIVPRPIALVSTRSKDGLDNLAPFSFFNAVSSNPATLMISVARRLDGSKKDTLRNIEETGELVINTSSSWMVGPITHAGANYPYGVSELKEIGLTPLQSTKVAPLRVKESPVHLRHCHWITDQDCTKYYPAS